MQLLLQQYTLLLLSEALILAVGVSVLETTGCMEGEWGFFNSYLMYKNLLRKKKLHFDLRDLVLIKIKKKKRRLHDRYLKYFEVNSMWFCLCDNIKSRV